MERFGKFRIGVMVMGFLVVSVRRQTLECRLKRGIPVGISCTFGKLAR